MNKERYIKPEIKTEVLESEVLNNNYGSGGGFVPGGTGTFPRPRWPLYNW